MADVLATQIFAGGEYKEFGEMTLADVRARAEELSGIGAVGGLARLTSIAHAWGRFAQRMEAAQASRVAELDDAGEWAEKLWVVPPGGSLL